MQISRKYLVATLLSLCLIHIGVPSLVRGEKDGKLNEPSLVAPDRVGSRGDPQRIIISSNETFTAAAIRKGLGRNRDFIVASHPEASFDPFQAVVIKAIREGYRRNGFPDVKVGAKLDADGSNLLVSIQEGRRCKNGEVTISGVPNAKVEETLRKRLQQRESRKSSSRAGDVAMPSAGIKEVWGRNEYADLHGCRSTHLTSRVGGYLRELGCYFEDIDVHIVSHPSEETASLHIDVTGCKTSVAVRQIRVEFNGDHKNSVAQVLDYLNLQEGMEVNSLMVEGISNRLYYSARFLKSEVSVQPTTPKTGEMDLVIKLMEYAKAPGLLEPFSREEQALLKFREWLLETGEHAGDLVLSITNTQQSEELIRWVYAPGRGVVGVAGDISAAPDFILMLTSSRAGICLPAVEHSFMWPLSQFIVRASMRVKVSEENIEENPISFGMFCGWSSVKGTAPIQFDVAIDPVCMIGMLNRRLSNYRWDGQTLVISRENGDEMHLQFDESDEQRLTGVSLRTNRKPLVLRLSRQPDAFEQLERSASSIADAVPNALKSPEPVTSSVLALADIADGSADWLQATLSSTNSGVPKLTAETIRAGTQVIRNLADQEFFALADHILKRGDEADAPESFFIPCLGDHKPLSNIMLTMLGQLGLTLSSKYFPDESWPIVLFREIVHVSYGNTQHTGEIFESLYEDTDQIGPVGYLLIAEVIKFMNPRQSSSFARRGLEHMTAADFERDWRLFLPQDSAEKECLAACLKTLSAIGDDEVDALARLGDFEVKIFGGRPQNLAESMRGFFETLEAQPGKPTEELLGSAMAYVWEHNLRAVTELKLTDNSRGLSLDPRVVAATVNGVTIPRAEVDAIVAAKLRSNPSLDPAVKQTMVAMLEQQALRGLLGTELVYQEYHRTLHSNESGLEESLLDEFTRTRCGNSREQLMQHCASTGYSLSGVRKTLLANEIMKQKLSKVSSPTEEELRDYYKKHESEYARRKESVHLHMIGIPVESKSPPQDRDGQRAHIEQIRARIVGGADFTAMAQEYIKATGCWGEQAVEGLSRPLREIVRSIEMNTVSEVVEFNQMFYIVQITGRQPAGKPSFEQVKSEIEAAILLPRRQQAQVEWMTELQGKADIKTFARPVLQPTEVEK